MKKLFTLIAVGSVFGLSAQTTHNLSNSGNTFNPAILNIVVGDIVNWVGASNHNVIEISEADWMTNTPNSNGGFWLGLNSPTSANSHTFTAVGTYYFICAPHASMGMKGQIVVTSGVGVENTVATPVAVTLKPNGAGQFVLTGKEMSRITVFGMNGQVVRTESLVSTDEQAVLDFSALASGTYVAVAETTEGASHSLRFVKQ